MPDEKFDYTKNDLVDVLRKLGLKPGDSAFSHSNIGFFGILKGANTPEDYYQIFKQAIFEVIEPRGTLVVPTFSYSFCNKEIFDPKATKGVCGIFSEMVRKDPQAVRSYDANFSIAAIGGKAKYFTGSPPEHSFGQNCFWERFLNANGKFMNFNFDSGSTFFHYVEKKLNVPYRYDKGFPGVSIINGREKPGIFYHFVYDKDIPNNGPDFTKFDKKAKETGLAKTVDLGKGQIVCILARDTFDLIKSELPANPTFLIQGDYVK